MSSWANRKIPRKRDISQIPEEFRPEIIPRFSRPEILLSESYQTTSQNEIIIKTKSYEDKKKTVIEPVVNPRQYVTKKINTTTIPSAIELIHNEKTYVFVILRNLRSTRDNDLWISSYNSIRKYYTNKIIIIDDNSSINTVNSNLINTEIIISDFNGAGEILPYYYFLKYKWADKMIFIHDSMFINRPFRDNELEGKIRFHWQFSKNNESNDFRKIINYLSMLTNNIELQAYATDITSTWFGCFGGTSICNLDLIQSIEEDYKLFSSLVLSIRTRKDRETFERIFGIILYYEGIFDNEKCSNYGDIFKYPKAFETEYVLNIENIPNILKQYNYDTAIMKVWRGR
jgi:hypothetical protein